MYSCSMKVLRNAAPRSGSLLIPVSVVFGYYLYKYMYINNFFSSFI